MPSPLVTSTIQACVLSATSNLIAQYITAYRSDVPYTVDWTPVFQFVIFTILNCPPNFLWQSYLETTFPSTHLVPSNAAIAAASASNEKTLDKEEATNTLLEPKLSKQNTLIKFLLDQTLGAALNTLFFSLVFAGFKGATWNQAVQIAKQDFRPLIVAGWKLWPAVSLLSFVGLRTVESRTLVGSLAGMGWGVYLSLVAGGG